MSLVVNLFAGPGAGKSTLAAMVFAHIKALGPLVSVELAPEVAKEMVFEERALALNTQEYILGQQRLRIERLIGKIDVIITDAPILNSAIYAPSGYPGCFMEFVRWCHHRHPSFNIFVDRPASVYESAGRYHTEIEALALDQQIVSVLTKEGVALHHALPQLDSASLIAAKILGQVAGARVGQDRAGSARAQWSSGLV